MGVLNTDLSCHTAFWKLEINYKITKIVRALWFAVRVSVCMRVCKHGCDIKMFCFSRANHARSNLKKVLSWKPRQVYFIHPFSRRLKLGKSVETCCVNFFFRLSWHFKRKRGLITLTSVVYMQDFATGNNFSFNQCSRSNRKLFSCVCIAWSKHSRGWENSRQLCKPETKPGVCI